MANWLKERGPLHTEKGILIMKTLGLSMLIGSLLVLGLQSREIQERVTDAVSSLRRINRRIHSINDKLGVK